MIAVGGDGTVNMVASQLINTQLWFGIIPTGSANGLAYNLGMPAGLDAALQVLC